MTTEDRPHPAEIDFKAWTASWMTVRIAAARAKGERIPSARQMAREMMAELMRATEPKK